MRFFLLSFTLLVLSSTIAQAQNEVEISGIVSDSLENAIPFATITIEGTSSGCSANEAGEFKLRVPFGVEVTLLVQSVGYQPIKIVRKFTTNRPKPVAFLMTPKVTTLNEISVLG